MNLFMVELAVGDVPAALAWFRDVLGLAVLMDVPADGFALLQAGAGRVALKRQMEAGPPVGCKLVFEVSDLDATLARLAAQGVLPNGPLKVSAEGYRRAHVTGPEGHGLILFEHVFRGARGA